MKKRNLTIILLSIIWVILFSCEKSIEIDDPDENETESSEEAEDYTWDSSDTITIFFNSNSITADSDSVSIDGSTVTITKAGNYIISGTLSNGQIIVNSDDEEVVRLILSGVDMTCSSSAPIYVKDAYKTIIVLDDGTENYITDSNSYVFDDSEDDEPNAAIFSKDYLAIYGNGYLTVNGNYNDGIASKDGLVIKSGNITVNSVDDGIRGKDYLIIRDGNITLNVEGDGLKSDNDEDESLGYILIETGNIDIISGGDAIQAETDINITTGEFDITAGGGSNYSVSYDGSAKGLKADESLSVDGGNYTINSADDAVHSNGSIIFNGGTFNISSNDDGIHADESVEINNSNVSISKSYEGIESANITVNESNVRIIASDDGFNATEGMAVESNDGSCLTINSGYVYVNTSSGDALDSNGNIVIAGGTVIAHGPSSDPEVGMDYNGTCKVSGGTLVISGPDSRMTQAPSSSSTQYSVLVKFNTRQSANSIVHIEDSNGNDILTFAPVRTYQSIIFSSTELTKGSTYTIYTGGSYTSTSEDGLYTNGTYEPGVEYRNFTISQIVTNLN